MKRRVANVEWLWIDTCCINKQDAQEVPEAINCMFKWYRNAEVCLAYLVDVNDSNDILAFQQSEWFRRGWTLQELLAPRTVVFLTQKWEVIGHKGPSDASESSISLQTGPSLADAIASRTNISPTVLRDYEQSRSQSVAEKLTWLKDRATTREEDMSYCLFGIFDVAIGANYGGGGESEKASDVCGIERERSRSRSTPGCCRSCL